MKRFFILATAAIVALASCAKTEVVYNDAPEEIALSTVNMPMTKAFTEAMTVFAYLDGDEYFGNTTFAQSGTYWKAATAKYWPASGTLDFLVWAPADPNLTSTGATNLGGISKDTDDQDDLLYGSASGDKDDEYVNVELKHALSKVQINVAGDANVYLLGVELLNSTQKATAVVDFTTPAITWNADATAPKLASKALYTPTDDVDGDALSSTAKECTAFFVVPLAGTEASIKLTYKMAGSATVLEYETPSGALGEWAEGKHYIYNISVGANEIQLNPSVADWGTPEVNTL